MNEVVAELDRSDFEDSEDDLDGYLDMKSDDEYTIMTLALALAITLRTRRAILSLPWTAQHQSNTRNTATGFTWHPFVVARWVRVYLKVLLRSQFCLN